VDEKELELRPNLNLLAMRERDPQIFILKTCTPEEQALFMSYKAQPLFLQGIF